MQFIIGLKRKEKESACNAEDLGLIPGLGRSPGEGNDYPLLYSCLEISMDRGAWLATYSPWGPWVGHDWTTNTFIKYVFYKSFLPVYRLPSHFLGSIFCREVFFSLNLMKSNYQLSLSWTVPLVLYLKGCHHTQGHLHFLFCYLLGVSNILIIGLQLG